MPPGTTPLELQPQFSLSALLLVLVGVALIGNTVVGGLPDKLLALGKKGQGGVGGSGVAGAGGAGAGTVPAGTAPGSSIGPGVLGGGVGGPTQVFPPGTHAGASQGYAGSVV